MGLEALGKKQYASIIDHGVTMAKNVAEFVKSQPTLELVMQPQLASVLFRSRPAQMAGSDSAAIALLNQRVGDALLESGRANVGVTEHNGVTCLKLTLLNPVVTLDDVKVLLSLVERTARNCWRNKTLPISACPAKPITAVIGFSSSRPRFAQQLLDHLLLTGIITFAKGGIAQLSPRVEDIMRRPVLITKRIPDGVVVICDNRIV